MMEQAVGTYFALESSFSWIKLGLGLIGIVLGSVAWFRWGRFGKGFAFPMTAIGLIQLSVAGYIVWRTGPQVVVLMELLASDPAGFIALEQPRMAQVMANFTTFHRAQIGMGLVGFVMLALGHWRMPLVLGIGAGFAIFGPILFLQDTLAANRAQDYFEAILRFAAQA